MHNLIIFYWAIKLHLLRWSRYRADVFIWIFTIWVTIGVQALFVWGAFQAVGGNFFGYKYQDLIGFFGITLLAVGIAQSIVHGVILRLAHCVWRGQVDFWLTQPTSFFLRLLLEDIGLIWFMPHIIVGTILLLFGFPHEMWILGFSIAFVTSLIEMGLVITACAPTIRWGKWNPEEGLWEYLEKTRSIPIGRASSTLLWIASAGVIHYSLALEVLTGNISLWVLVAFACILIFSSWFSFSLFIKFYSSASS